MHESHDLAGYFVDIVQVKSTGWRRPWTGKTAYSRRVSLKTPSLAEEIGYADHAITIDPTWEFADLYALTYSIPEFTQDSVSVSTVPIPAAVWLFGSGLLGLVGMARRKKA